MIQSVKKYFRFFPLGFKGERHLVYTRPRRKRRGSNRPYLAVHFLAVLSQCGTACLSAHAAHLSAITPSPVASCSGICPSAPCVASLSLLLWSQLRVAPPSPVLPVTLPSFLTLCRSPPRQDFRRGCCEVFSSRSYQICKMALRGTETL